jgi:minor extracellular protease Epr
MRELLKLITSILVVAFVAYFLGMSAAKAEPIKIAVIDTGFDFNSNWPAATKLGLTKPKLCKAGHKDFTKTGLKDTHGHGTHIAGLIAKYADNADYCLVILKFYDSRATTSNLRSIVDAINYAVSLKVDFINLSLGGVHPSELERQAVLNALNANIRVVSAAGNEKSNLAQKGYYPALYDSRIVVVGATKETGERLPASNYGPQVTYTAIGHEVLSLGLNNTFVKESGTSQATAKITGFLVKINKK